MSDVVIDVKASARRMKAAGKSLPQIGRFLEEHGVRTPRGGEAWAPMQVQRYLDATDGPPAHAPAPQPPPAPAPQLPATQQDAEPDHEPGTLAWYEAQLRTMQRMLRRILDAELGRMDAQGAAAVGRLVEGLAAKCCELRAQAATTSTKGQTLEQREQRLAEAAKKMPTPLLEIFVLEWAMRNKVDLAQLREARLVRAEERGT